MNNLLGSFFVKLFTIAIMAIFAIGFTTTFAFAQENESRPDAYLEWDKQIYPSDGTGIVRVVDHYMNQDSEAIESLQVYVYTEETEDAGGITITVTEINTDAGIFEGLVLFSETGESKDNTIRIVQGEIVGAEYLYSSVPNSNEMDIGVGQEVTISNSEISSNSLSIPVIEKRPNAYPEWGADTYSSTDIATAKVIDPIMNINPNAEDTVTVMVSVKDDLDDGINILLIETGKSTGVFQGFVRFTETGESFGNTLKVTEGNKISLDYTYFDVIGSEKLQDMVEVGDHVMIKNSNDSKNMTNATLQGGNILGKVQWLEASYSETDTAVVRVIDGDMDLNSEEFDTFQIDVWSDSDAAGIDILLTETDQDSGVFEGTVYFSTTDESSGHRLRAVEGDTITAEYEDNMLPTPYSLEDQLDITDTTIIRNTDVPSPYKQMKNGVIAEHVVCNDEFERIFKSNGYPVCVKPSSVEKLIQRGWSTEILER